VLTFCCTRIDLADRARELTQAMPGLRIISIGDAANAKDLQVLAKAPQSTPPDRKPEADDVVVTIFTSGTTGKLKAVEHTQTNWAAMALNILANHDVREGDIMLHAASMIHASGCFILPYWISGGMAAVLPGFTPALEAHRAQHGVDHAWHATGSAWDRGSGF